MARFQKIPSDKAGKKDAAANEEDAGTGRERGWSNGRSDDAMASGNNATDIEQQKRASFLNNKGSGKASVRDLWAGALQDSKSNEENKFLKTK